MSARAAFGAVVRVSTEPESRMARRAVRKSVLLGAVALQVTFWEADCLCNCCIIIVIFYVW